MDGCQPADNRAVRPLSLLANASSAAATASEAASASASESLLPSMLPLPSVLKASCVPNSAQASQAVVIAGDDVLNPLLFPKGATDVNGQQVDLRRENSWMLRLHQVSTDEMQGIVECFVAGIGNKDSVGDICLPGAFNASLKRFGTAIDTPC